MGMFDTVHFNCPKCGALNNEQTKSGPCLMIDAWLDEQHPDLPAMTPGMGDRDGLFCSACATPLVIETVIRPLYRVVVAPDAP